MGWEADGRHRLRRERVQGKGKGDWREATGRRPLQTAIQPGVMLTAPRLGLPLRNASLPSPPGMY